MQTAEIARESITVSDTAIGFTTAQLTTKIMYARVQVQDQQVRIRLDGVDPVAGTSPGDLLSPGDIINIWGLTDMKRFRAIRESTDAKLSVSFHGGF